MVEKLLSFLRKTIYNHLETFMPNVFYSSHIFTKNEVNALIRIEDIKKRRDLHTCILINAYYDILAFDFIMPA